jgi:hypothetical protein
VILGSQDARRQARSLVETLAARSGGTDDGLRLAGVDLAGALEQQLFFALRDGRRPGRGLRATVEGAGELVRPIGAAALGLTGWRLPHPGDGPMAVLVRDPTHYPVLAQIEVELRSSGDETLALLRVGRAARATPAHAMAPRLVDLVDPRLALAAGALRGRFGATLRRGAGAWDAEVGEARATELRRIAALEAGRIALGAAALISVARRWRPSLLAAFDEVGTWARLLPAVARAHGIPSLDLPHAEAADAVAIQGVDYDGMATYGPRATAVLREAGVPAERIIEIGAPRFDPLVELAALGQRARDGDRVVFAAQHEAGAMRAPIMEACYRAAMAVAAATGAELVVVPHPAEAPGTAARVVRDVPAPASVASIRLAPAGDLHAEVIGARVLVTGWSNSVFEAAVAGVPAISVDPGGVAPVDFAADGLSLGAVDEASAAAVANALRDPAAHQAAVARAREVAEQRLGPLDGRASARAARLMLMLARGEPWRSAA